MSEGDMIICTELSRLGRNMLMIMGILNICSLKGISIRSIKDNFELSDNINSKIIAFAFALAAEIERNLISQRT
jgi:DNA invertase Pin-like site-specific DNA recombinase